MWQLYIAPPLEDDFSMTTGKTVKEIFMIKRSWLLFLALVSVVGGLWAQDASANSVLFAVDVTYVTQGGTRATDTISVLAADPRIAEREAEEQFKKTNPRSTFIRAVAKVAEQPVLTRSENRVSAPSASQTVSPNSSGAILFSVDVTYVTQGGTRGTDTISVLATDPREAEREAEKEFKKANSRRTFVRAVAK